jgi:hypothetical protein
MTKWVSIVLLLLSARAGVQAGEVRAFTQSGEITYSYSLDETSLVPRLQWHVYDEAGIEMSQLGSVCEGLDTAINYAVAHSRQLRVMGGGSSTFEPTVNCTATLSIPPIEKAHIELGAITLNFPPSIAYHPGIVFDSCLNSYVRMDGQITYFGKATPLMISPRNLLPIDKEAGVVVANCEVRINTAFGSGAQESVVDFDTSNGAVIGNLFDFDEIHAHAIYDDLNKCVGGYHGFRVLESATHHGFIGNRVAVRDLHGTCNLSAYIGATVDHAATTTIHDNIFDLVIHPWNQGYGVGTYGSNDEYHVSVLDDEAKGGIKTGIILYSSASFNRFYERSIQGNPALDDQSLAKNNHLY